MTPAARVNRTSTPRRVSGAAFSAAILATTACGPAGSTPLTTGTRGLMMPAF